MFLNEKPTGHMVEILNLSELFNPYQHKLKGRYQCGEEMQDEESFKKEQLEFLSGEQLPQCWLDPHYRDHELRIPH
jgi:hypothetical protein